jgi:hypothetical protein
MQLRYDFGDFRLKKVHTLFWFWGQIAELTSECRVTIAPLKKVDTPHVLDGVW